MQHLDEGTIHAWLDGELPADRASEIEAHASECAECAARVAEARGLIAASTRILTALDDVPAGLTPRGSAKPPSPLQRRHWYDRTDLRVAAALVVIAGTSLLVARRGPDSPVSRATLAVTDKIQAPRAETVPDTGIMKTGVGAEQIAASGEKKASSRNSATSPPHVTRRSSAGADASSLMMRERADEPRLRGIAGEVARSDRSALGSLEGRVTDRSNGQGVGAAQVMVEGSTLGATTDMNGYFKIDLVPTGAKRLAIRRIGYLPQSISLIVGDSASVTTQVSLARNVVSLNEVVATGIATAVGDATPPLRVLRVDSLAGTRRTVYEVSPGVEVTLTESPVDAATERNFATRQAAARNLGAALRVGAASPQKTRDSVSEAAAPAAQGPVSTTTRAAPIAMAPAATALVPVKAISWVDQSRRYTLSGRLSTQELEAFKTWLMQARLMETRR
jgi:anti-sigma factor RsiW